MKKLLTLAFLVFILSSCDKGDNKQDSCDCKDVIGHRYSPQIKKENADKDFVYEDFILNKNGTIDIWRYDGGPEQFIKSAATYELKGSGGNCMIKSVPDPKYVLTDPFFHITMTQLEEFRPFTILNCNTFLMSIITFSRS